MRSERTGMRLMDEQQHVSAASGRGRPRDPAVDIAILEATLRQMAEEGYGRMSVGAIAAAAGVTKPTIYLRWPSKADLATAALAHLQAQAPPPTTGRTIDDLHAVLRNFQASLLRPNGMTMIGTLLVEERHTPELIALFRERILKPRRQMVRAVLEAAAQRGELQPDADLDAAVNLLIGSYYARYLSGEGVPPDWPERIVATVWRGIARDGQPLTN